MAFAEWEGGRAPDIRRSGSRSHTGSADHVLVWHLKAQLAAELIKLAATGSAGEPKNLWPMSREQPY